MKMRTASAAFLVTLLVAATHTAVRANAIVMVVNNDGPNEGFNDPTPRAPIGGNTGTTLGQQRLIAFQFAASKWGATLDSPVPIVVRGNFDPLTCTPTGATLGAAGSPFIFANFGSVGLSPGPVGQDLWHGSAIADKRAGADLNPGVRDITAQFNSNLNGNPACLGGRGFYMGLDANHGTDIDLVAVLLHEFGHGMGFQQFASVTTGARPALPGTDGFDDIYNVHIYDNTQQKFWPQMTNAERAASAINPRNVVFDGSEVDAAVPSVLAPGTPLLTIASPASIAGIYQVGTAQFGAPLSSPGVTGQVVVGLDAANVTGPLTTDACTALTNAAAVAGNIALVDRGTCGFAIKALNVQNAGAIAMIVANNVAGGPPAGMAGVDPTVTIPSVLITLADANNIKGAVAAGPVTANVGVNLAVFSGADAHGFALLYTPNPVQGGSTISHWDTIAFPNQLMEPAINGDLTHSVQPPQDLTLPLLRDVGWFPDTDIDGLANDLDACSASNFETTVTIDGESTGVANVLFTSGCTISDLIGNVAAAATNHGRFVSQMNVLLQALEDAGIITKDESKRMHNLVAHADTP